MLKNLTEQDSGRWTAVLDDHEFYFEFRPMTQEWQISWRYLKAFAPAKIVGAATDLKAAVWFAEDWLIHEGYTPRYDTVEEELRAKLNAVSLEPVSLERKKAPWAF
jgi:hypothetical protein